MLSEQEQRKYLKIMFPDKGEDISFGEWKEFHNIVFFDEFNNEDQKDVFLKYAKESIDYIREREITNLLIDINPSLASDVIVDYHHKLNLIELWDLHCRKNSHDPLMQDFLDFIEKHADACYDFMNKIDGFNKLDDQILLSALKNEKYSQMLDQQACQYIEKGEKVEFPTKLSLLIHIFEYDDIYKPANHFKVFQILTKAAEVCPHVLMAKGYHLEGHENAQTIVQFAYAKEKQFKDDCHVEKFLTVKNKLPIENRHDFIELISHYEPIAATIMQIHETHPEILDVKDDNGISLAEQLGLNRTAKQINEK